MKLLESSKELEVIYNFPLKKLTSIKVGGEALLFIPHTYSALEELTAILGDRFYILGGGSAILAEERITTPVIKLGREFVGIERKDETVLEVGSATFLSSVLNYCLKNNLEGLEEFAGMPATVGGMAKLDATCFGKNFLSLVEEMEVFFSGRIYRMRRIEKNEKGIITKVRIRLKASSKGRKRLNYFLGERLKRQDFSFPSAGCIFKNPKNISAGFLIERCGLKGRSVGDAFVSLKHANFILNRGEAIFRDIEELILLIKREVREIFGIELEEKIIKWRN